MQGSQELELWRYLESQRRLAARLIEGDSLDQVAPGFLEIVADLLDWEAGALWEVVGEEKQLRLVYGRGAEDLDTGLLAEARQSGAIALAPAALAIPIPTGSPQNVLAIVEFHTTSFNPQSEELMGLLGGFADQLGTFISRRRAEATSAEAERFRNHLAEVVRGTQDAVLSKDLEGIVTSWNPAAGPPLRLQRRGGGRPPHLLPRPARPQRRGESDPRAGDARRTAGDLRDRADPCRRRPGSRSR